MRRYAAGTALAVVLPLGLAGCGSADAEAGQSAGPSTAAVESSVSPSPTPSSTPSGPAAQPKGEHGVTYQVLNWDDYAEDPAVLGWKHAYELVNASTNADKLLPGVTELVAKKPLRMFAGNLQLAWRNDLHVKPVAKVRIVSTSGKRTRRAVVMCQWAPSAAYYQRNGKPYGKVERQWERGRFDMVRRDGRWLIAGVKAVGTCPGGAPR